MVDDAIEGRPGPPSAAQFATTRWSLVRAAGDAAAPAAADALETLCQAYWLPLYLFVRRQGHEPADAEDLTQAFFERVLEKNYLAQARQEKGRFRSFLLASLRHFLSDQRDRRTAVKRGGEAHHLSLDVAVAEATYAQIASHEETPEKIYERQWAMAVLARAQDRLRAECLAAGKSELYRELGESDAAAARESYAEIGTRFGMTENAVKLAAFRLRRRYQDLIREEIGETLARPEEIDEEIRHLLRVLAG